MKVPMSILRQFWRALNVALQQTQSSVFPPPGWLREEMPPASPPASGAAGAKAQSSPEPGHPAGSRAGRAGEERRTYCRNPKRSVTL